MAHSITDGILDLIKYSKGRQRRCKAVPGAKGLPLYRWYRASRP